MAETRGVVPSTGARTGPGTDCPYSPGQGAGDGSVAEQHSEFTWRSVTAAWAASVGMFVGTTPMISAVASLFVIPITSEFHISRTFYSTLMLVQPYIVALCSPFGGRLIDRYGTRRVLLPVVLAFGLAQWAMWGAGSLWQIIAVFAFTGILGGVHTYTAYTRVISSWFARRRGVVLGFMLMMGSSLGSVLVVQLVKRLIPEYGWRAGYVGMGCVILFYGLPVMWLFLREPVRAARGESGMASAPSAVAPNATAVPLSPVPPADADAAATHAPLPGMTRAEAMRTRTFWTIFIALTFAPMAIIGTIGQSVPMLQSRGFPLDVASNAVSSVYIGAMLAQTCSGFLLDRFDSPRIALPFFAAAFIGVLIMHTSQSASTLLPGAVLMGMGQGTEMGIGAYLISRFFGMRHFASIYSFIFAASNLGLGLGIISMGTVYDRWHSYAPMKYVMPTALVLAMLLFLSLGPYRFAKETAVSDADRRGRR